MCQEVLSEAVYAEDLIKIVQRIKDGRYSYNPSWTPYVIARNVLNQEFDGVMLMGTPVAADFLSAIRLEERLINEGIGGNDTIKNTLPALPAKNPMTPGEKQDYQQLLI